MDVMCPPPPKYMKPEKLPSNSEKFNFILQILAKVKVTGSSSSCVSHHSHDYFMFLPACERETCLNKQVTASLEVPITFT